MSTKVKRGLGLLAAALLAFLVATALTQTLAGQSDAADWVVWLVVLALAVGCLLAAVAGLALVAWGLLRD